jgi:hypothetical protein
LLGRPCGRPQRDVVRFGAGGAGSHGQGARNVVVAVPAVFGCSWRTPQNLDFFFRKGQSRTLNFSARLAIVNIIVCGDVWERNMLA